MSNQPELSEFDDWSVESFGPIPSGDENTLTDHQKAIVSRNVELLLDRDKWTEKVARFQTLVEQQPNEDVKKAFLKRYVIHFDHAQFDNADGSVSFFGIVFPAAVSFRGVKFSGGDADFSHAEFRGGNADFKETEFSGGDADFSYAEFSGGAAYFRGAEFSGGDANFIDAEFSGGDASFFGAEFSGGDADFSDAEFSGGDANFIDAEFSGGDAHFFGAEFSGGDANFIDAEFSGGDANFSEVEFSGGDANFHNAELSGGDTSFHNAEFKSAFALFTGYCKSLDLFGATFHSLSTLTVKQCHAVPDFRHTKFDRPPNLSQLNIKERKQVNLFTLNRDQSIVDKWRVLKQLAQDSGDDEKAGQFFANEMAAKRGTEITAFGPLLVSWLYMTFSNFGQCYVRPLWGLLGLWASFGVGYYLSLPKQFEGFSGALIAAQLSLQNSLPFISSIGRFTAQPNTDGYVGWFQQQINTISDIHGGFDHFLIPSIIQQAIGAILLFLLILGLRNVFRMK